MGMNMERTLLMIGLAKVTITTRPMGKYRNKCKNTDTKIQIQMIEIENAGLAKVTIATRPRIQMHKCKYTNGNKNAQTNTNIR